MSFPTPIDHQIMEEANAEPITEISTNTFVINLQQAIFSLETGSSFAESNNRKPSEIKNDISPRKHRHFLTGTELSSEEIMHVLQKAKAIKQNPSLYYQTLIGKSLAMIFEKPSFRTRLSFAMAIQSMGGIAIESIGNTRKQEDPADMARVLNGYADLIMMRTHADEHLLELANHAKVPVINGLTALHHPCQILADLFSLWEQFGALEGLTVAYIGDGNNILHSLMLLAPQLGVKIHYCCPKSNQPNAAILQQAQTVQSEMIHHFCNPEDAVKHADAVYTDVWTSMGFEEKENNVAFEGFQVNELLMSYAKPKAVFMHCMPMERGKEVSDTLPDSPASIIFSQSENRMHVQKALMLYLHANIKD
ncbi:ornithine carbamoyltransferase [Legionella waltersii]|uniref:Ornithine carbamoyltransferase n=1 Tax=Legionella waltersii TaxID=66969 RepID=A0A0W1AAE6_9GAMM|nr:ornithine carbamoyltransferase [Legionella waltersii]KTD78321.1 Ornithine carbamoyltransferase [Legionella waltersii]SNV08720.1 Ornithine carbamoyltransferase [Legionella waltersii]